MKSKYILTLFLIGILPLLALAGVYYWMALNQPAPVAQSTAPALNVDSLQVDNQTIASALSAAIQGTYQNISGLTANHSDTDLNNFVNSHPGVKGVAVFSANGKLLKTIPASFQLADPNYGSSDEFQKMMGRFKDNGGKTDLYFSLHFSYPAFIFSVPLDSSTVVQAILDDSFFFQPYASKGGEIYFFDAQSGQYFYHSNPAKLQTTFSPGQEKWLAKVQTALTGQQKGWEISDDNTQEAVFAPVGIKAFGIVRVVPKSLLQAPAAVATHPVAGFEGLPEIFQTPIGNTLLIASVACLGWILLIGSICFSMIIAPLKKAGTLVLNAANGRSTLTPETAKRFGGDDVGQMVQAAALLLQKLEQDKQQAAQENEETLRKGRSELDNKTREAANQVAAAQQQAQSAKSELNDKNQQLGDKLKELDALKSMSEGLRNQTEQAKAEIGKLKAQVGTSEDAKNALQTKSTQTQAQLEDQLRGMESKLLSAVAASSAIQVSSVRAAAIRTMAEELKTTLGIIKGYVSSALGVSQGGINEKQQEFLGMVINRSARLEKFINDLLDIYQVEIDQATASHEEISLAPEIEGLAFNFQAQADVKSIKIKVESKGTLPKIPVVRRRFNQLWNILYLQIIKDAPRGSTIPITVEPMGDSVKVTLQDPGMIVVPEALPKLFDEFYDPKHTASPQLAGTGLKLALVKTILAAHGGGAVAEKGDPGTKLTLTLATKIKKPGESPLPTPTPVPAAAVKPVPPPAPTAIPSLRPVVAPPGMGLKPPPPSIGIPRPAPPSPAVPAVAGTPRPPGAPGLLDSLISKVPSVMAPGLRPAGTPAPLGTPPTPGMIPPSPAPLGLKPPAMGVPGTMPPPKPPTPGVSGAPTPTPAAPGLPPTGPKPTPSAPGLLDSLLEKKSPAPPMPSPAGAPQVAPPGPTPMPIGTPAMGAPRPAMPGMPTPGAPTPTAPGVPGMGAPRPAVPGAPSMGVPSPMAPKPVVPGAPSPVASPQAGMPPMAPRPAAPSVPGMGAPPLGGMPTAPKPTVPGGMPTPGSTGSPQAGAPVGAPKVVPTSIKPTVPPPGILDLDSQDGMKLDAGTPKPPMQPPGAPKPPSPGVPPGGLDASKAMKPKEEGDLIE